jgi:DNA-binding transcriptional MocR family regulator
MYMNEAAILAGKGNLSTSARSQYFVMASHVNNETNRWKLKKRTIAKETGTSLSTVTRNNRELALSGMIRFTPRSVNGWKRCNEYEIITDPALWLVVAEENQRKREMEQAKQAAWKRNAEELRKLVAAITAGASARIEEHVSGLRACGAVGKEASRGTVRRILQTLTRRSVSPMTRLLTNQNRL